MTTAWLMGYKTCDEVNPAEGGAAARLAAKDSAAPAKAYDTNSGVDKTEFGDLIVKGINFDQGIKHGVVQSSHSLAFSGRQMMLLFLVTMIGSVSADACGNPCASGTCGSLQDYLSCSDFTELNCDCAGCCSMPPPSMPPPLQHHAPSAPPPKMKVAAAILTAVAGKKLMDKVPDELTCSESEVPMCEEIESLETENNELKLKVDALETQAVDQGVTIAELELKAELLEADVASLKRFVGMMPPAAPPPPPPSLPPASPPAAPPPSSPPYDETIAVACCSDACSTVCGKSVTSSPGYWTNIPPGCVQDIDGCDGGGWCWFNTNADSTVKAADLPSDQIAHDCPVPA